MFGEERRRRILERLRADGKVSVEALAEAFGVSAPTVRADLAELAQRRLLRRTHGGAIPLETSVYEPPFAEREAAHTRAKRRIGEAAAARIQPGETVILDAGTTTHAVGVALAHSKKRDITVITNNLPTALLLMEAPGITTLVIGGAVQPPRRATLGPLAAAFLAPIQADRCFLGVSGVDANAGFTAADFDAAHLKRVMMEHAAEIIVVADAAKIGQIAFAQVAPLHHAALLLTDQDYDEIAAVVLHDQTGLIIERV